MALFETGRWVFTPGALEKVFHADMIFAVRRHRDGDWGEAINDDPHDKALNDACLKHGGRLFSCYTDCRGTKFYIITEADRSVTTILLPDEY